jgi:hypothetical protein
MKPFKSDCGLHEKHLILLNIKIIFALLAPKIWSAKRIPQTKKLQKNWCNYRAWQLFFT